jgi:hypothetical protein
MGPRQQGDLGELSAMEWFGRQGATIFVPVTHSPDVDLIVTREGRMERVQVKTSRSWRANRFEVSICTRGGNQSWNGLVSVFSPQRCDLLFVLVADGRRWCIPAAAVEATQGLRLGGPKYSEYEVERGLPFAEVPAMANAAQTRLSL